MEPNEQTNGQKKYIYIKMYTNKIERHSDSEMKF